MSPDSPLKLKPALYLVGTPIGNLQDITLRALDVLRSVDLVAAEDTRHTRKLLNHFDIQVKTVSYREENHEKAAELIVDTIEKNKAVALVSDAGMPCISDPGVPLIQYCLERNVSIEIIPGVSAVTTAAARSGMSQAGFIFAGFPPVKTTARQTFFKDHTQSQLPCVFFEAPHRLIKSLQDLQSIVENREVFLGREITKMHEQWLRGSIEEILLQLKKEKTIRGEFTLVVAPKQEENANEEPDEASLKLLFKQMTDKGIHPNEAIKAIALQTGLHRNFLYDLLRKDK
jgi:16S rRNA (cytidine1402-2'-O)-methyltransferase